MPTRVFRTFSWVSRSIRLNMLIIFRRASSEVELTARGRSNSGDSVSGSDGGGAGQRNRQSRKLSWNLRAKSEERPLKSGNSRRKTSLAVERARSRTSLLLLWCCRGRRRQLVSGAQRLTGQSILGELPADYNYASLASVCQCVSVSSVAYI